MSGAVLHLTGGLRVDADGPVPGEKIASTVEQARKHGRLVEIGDGEGRRWSINPEQVVMVEWTKE